MRRLVTALLRSDEH